MQSVLDRQTALRVLNGFLSYRTQPVELNQVTSVGARAFLEWVEASSGSSQGKQLILERLDPYRNHEALRGVIVRGARYVNSGLMCEVAVLAVPESLRDVLDTDVYILHSDDDDGGGGDGGGGDGGGGGGGGSDDGDGGGDDGGDGGDDDGGGDGGDDDGDKTVMCSYMKCFHVNENNNKCVSTVSWPDADGNCPTSECTLDSDCGPSGEVSPRDVLTAF